MRIRCRCFPSLITVPLVGWITAVVLAVSGTSDAIHAHNDSRIDAWTLAPIKRLLLDSTETFRSPEEQVLYLNFDGMQDVFSNERQRMAERTSAVKRQWISFVLPESGSVECELVPSQLFHPDLAKELPEVITRTGRCSDSRRINLNMILNEQDSFSASFSIPDKNDWLYVDNKKPKTNEYVIYRKSTAVRRKPQERFSCGAKRKESSKAKRLRKNKSLGRKLDEDLPLTPTPSPAFLYCPNAQRVELLLNETSVTVKATNIALDTAGTAFTCSLDGVLARAKIKTFVFTAPRTGVYKATTCDGTWDSVMQVRIGACDGPVLGCNDDTSFSIKFCSTQQFVVDEGDQVFIQVGMYQASQPPAQFTLTISWQPEVRGGMFRLALVTNREFSIKAGDTKPKVANVVAAIISRVNGIYLRELGVFFQLIAGNERLFCSKENIKLGGCSRLGNDASIINKNQHFIETSRKIRSTAYDIGHSFTTGSGGVAGLGVLCTSGKARGTTGSPNPKGDPFSVDYVAHELGHQLNGDHTFRDCPPQAQQTDETSAVEPASGSTIMAYAGICDSPYDLQSNSDPYFHGLSLQVMRDFVHSKLRQSPSCGSGLTYSVPLTMDANEKWRIDKKRMASTCSIPVGNFVRLRGVTMGGSATVSESARYQWDQMDPGKESFTGVPLIARFRSWKPVRSPDRYLPNLYYLTHSLHTQTPFKLYESLPLYPRSMTFRFVARTLYDTSASTSAFDVGLFGDFSFRDVSVQFTHAIEPLLFDSSTRNALAQGTIGTNSLFTFTWTAGGAGVDYVSVYIALNTMVRPVTKFDYERDVKDLDWILVGTAANSDGAGTFLIPEIGSMGENNTVQVNFLLAPAGAFEQNWTCTPFDYLPKQTLIQYTRSPTTGMPSTSPTTTAPSAHPTEEPSHSPTTSAPSKSPTTSSPSESPTTSSPSSSPSFHPTRSPTTSMPSTSPTTSIPSTSPTTSIPSEAPSRAPTGFVPLRCQARPGRAGPSCKADIAFCRSVGYPIKWTTGCVVKGKRAGDGGCQCKGYCAYKCPTACRHDLDCTWRGSQCVSRGSLVPGGVCVREKSKRG